VTASSPTSASATAHRRHPTRHRRRRRRGDRRRGARIVTPGFVDIHTHYDGQATWDEVLDPTSGHGVTTVVMGNCGVGFAPVRPGSEAWLVQLMEGVEDIPGTALHEGITWEWESFPEYLDALDARRFTMDVAAYVGHGPVRAYVMGERGARNEPATAEDIAEMGRLVREAIEAGAVGFSSSRTLNHKARDGEPVPGTFAAMDELDGIADSVVAPAAGCSRWPRRDWSSTPRSSCRRSTG
jgi:N-acyl-D-amino-acid deacylase